VELGEAAGDQLVAASSLPLLTAIIDETLRLYPPLWFIGRVPAEETRFGDIVVPAGTRILCSPYVLHRRPAWWRDPDRFIPERFLQANSGGRAAFLPFGLGPRACVGQMMARLEISTALSVLVRRFRFNLATGCMPQPGGAYTLHPRNPVGVFLEPRCRHVAR
jgi:cytochrome P450